MYNYMPTSDELYHYGILNMKWGVRRYQNKDGSLTEEGRKRKNKLREMDQKTKDKIRLEKAKARNKIKLEKAKVRYAKKVNKKLSSKADNKESDSKPKQKTISEMTDDEIRAKISRMKLENELRSMTPVQKTRAQKFISGFSKIAMPTLTKAAQNVGQTYVENMLKKKLGLTDNQADGLSKLKQEAEKYKIMAEISDNKVKIHDNKNKVEEKKQESPKTDYSKFDDNALADLAKRYDNLKKIEDYDEKHRNKKW